MVIILVSAIACSLICKDAPMLAFMRCLYCLLCGRFSQQYHVILDCASCAMATRAEQYNASHVYGMVIELWALFGS